MTWLCFTLSFGDLDSFHVGTIFKGLSFLLIFLHLTKEKELCRMYITVRSGHGIHYFHPRFTRTVIWVIHMVPYNCKGGWEMEPKCGSMWQRHQGIVKNIFCFCFISISSPSTAFSPSVEKQTDNKRHPKICLWVLTNIS